MTCHILFAIGCRLEAVYRTRIEAESLAEQACLTLWDIGPVPVLRREQGYTRLTHTLLPLDDAMKLVPHVLTLLLRHRRWQAALFLSAIWLPLLPLALLPSRPASPAAPGQRGATLSRERLKTWLHRLGLYNHGKSVAYLILLLRHALTHYAYWRNHAAPYAAVHVKDADTLLFGALLKLQTNCRLVYNCYEFSARSMPQAPRWLTWLVIRFERGLADLADSVITVTPSMAELLKARLSLHAPISWIPNVDRWPAQAVFPRRDLFTQAQGRVTCIYQGAFSAERGLPELITAWTKVEGAALFLRGPRGRDAQRYQRMAQTLGVLDKSIFFLPPIDVPGKETLAESLAFLAGADIGFILYDPACLNNKNACPRKLSHHLLAGNALIATPMDYVAAIIDEAECGTVIPALTPDAIAESVNRYVRDPTFITRCRQHARRYAETHYRWDCFKTRYLKAALPEDCLYPALPVCKQPGFSC